MSESHKFSTVEKAREVFPGIQLRENKTRNTIAVYNSKENAYADIEEGQYIVKIADRFEVHDEEPDKAKKAEAPKASKKSEGTPTRDAQEGKSSEDTPKAVEGNQTVVPEELGTAPGPESK